MRLPTDAWRLCGAVLTLHAIALSQPPTIEPYDDVRRILGRLAPGAKDVSQVDLSQLPDILPTLTFNQKTIWPDASRMPPGPSPDELLKAAMNPGLGVRELHRQGITGLGVRVAIIDQPMYQDHPEFAAKIAAHFDTGCGLEKASLHGPAVTSLLVGSSMGTAPEAMVYYAAAPSWSVDADYPARGLEWILEENRKLPPESRIRVVSVSSAPSGPGSPFKQNNARWDQVTALAEAEGLLVLDCTSHRRIIFPAWLAGGDPEDPANYAPGFPGRPSGTAPATSLMAPASFRTTAEQYEPGDFGYMHTGRGGLSWAIPYVAGVLALGWQVRPELDATQMVQLLFQSAYLRDEAGKIIQPTEFLRLVREFQPESIPQRAAPGRRPRR